MGEGAGTIEHRTALGGYIGWLHCSIALEGALVFCFGRAADCTEGVHLRRRMRRRTRRRREWRGRQGKARQDKARQDKASNNNCNSNPGF